MKASLSSLERFAWGVVAVALGGVGVAYAVDRLQAPASIPAAHARAWDQALAKARVVHLNTATFEELERLPGIGPKLALRILDERDRRGRFLSFEELAGIPGIGPVTLDRLEPYVSVE